MSFNNLGIIVVNSNESASKLTLEANLISNLTKVGYVVEKVVAIASKQHLIRVEIENCLNLFQFVLIFYGNTNEQLNLGLQELFGVKLSPPNGEFRKILTCTKCESCQLQPVVYLQRLFLVDTYSDLSETFDKILQPYLEYFICPKPLGLSLVVDSKTLNLNFNDKHVRIDYEEDLNGTKLHLASNSLNELLDVEKRILLKNSTTNVTHHRDFSITYNNLKLCVGYENIKRALDIIEETYRKYGPENTFISFNGGKDCTVLLHLMLVVLHNKYPSYRGPFFGLYVQNRNLFPEVEDFVEKIKKFYDLDLFTLTKNIKDSLGIVLQNKPNLKACLMGTRRTDPYSHLLSTFQMTDNGWPQIMRVFPLLDWVYSDIWDYLLTFHVPYCSLYDNGYTSLGNTNDTFPNPYLRRHDTNENKYLPAHKLLDGSKERSGREH